MGTSLTDDDTRSLCEANKKGDDAVRDLETEIGKNRMHTAGRQLGALLQSSMPSSNGPSSVLAAFRFHLCPARPSQRMRTTPTRASSLTGSANRCCFRFDVGCKWVPRSQTTTRTGCVRPKRRATTRCGLWRRGSGIAGRAQPSGCSTVRHSAVRSAERSSTLTLTPTPTPTLTLPQP